MKIILSLVALLLACGTGTVKAQSSTKILKPVSNKQLVALNFIDDISFTPEVNNVPLLKTKLSLNTSTLTPLAEVVA